MRKYRKKLISWLFVKSEKIYTKYFKQNTPWNINKQELLQLPKITFGNKLGEFLNTNGFDLIPKVERHDAYHVLTNYGTNEEDEIALQYVCFGNGKRSLYLFGVLILGTLIIPDYYKYYYKSYCLGKSINVFYNLDYKNLLSTSFSDVQQTIFTKTQLNELKNV